LHSVQKSNCRECKGTSMCIHDKFRSYCIECCPDSKYFCLECRVTRVTPSKKQVCFKCSKKINEILTVSPAEVLVE
jgi:hypothetical protein